jgi:hypothetical protein
MELSSPADNEPRMPDAPVAVPEAAPEAAPVAVPEAAPPAACVAAPAARKTLREHAILLDVDDELAPDPKRQRTGLPSEFFLPEWNEHDRRNALAYLEMRTALDTNSSGCRLWKFGKFAALKFQGVVYSSIQVFAFAAHHPQVPLRQHLAVHAKCGEGRCITAACLRVGFSAVHDVKVPIFPVLRASDLVRLQREAKHNPCIAMQYQKIIPEKVHDLFKAGEYGELERWLKPLKTSAAGVDASAAAPAAAAAASAALVGQEKVLASMPALEGPPSVATGNKIPVGAPVPTGPGAGTSGAPVPTGPGAASANNAPAAAAASVGNQEGDHEEDEEEDMPALEAPRRSSSNKAPLAAAAAAAPKPVDSTTEDEMEEESVEHQREVGGAASSEERKAHERTAIALADWSAADFDAAKAYMNKNTASEKGAQGCQLWDFGKSKIARFRGVTYRSGQLLAFAAHNPDLLLKHGLAVDAKCGDRRCITPKCLRLLYKSPRGPKSAFLRTLTMEDIVSLQHRAKNDSRLAMQHEKISLEKLIRLRDAGDFAGIQKWLKPAT